MQRMRPATVAEKVSISTLLNDQFILVLQMINRQSCTITEKAPTFNQEKAPTRVFSWLKAPTSAFTFKTLLRHYAKRATGVDPTVSRHEIGSPTQLS